MTKVDESADFRRIQDAYDTLCDILEERQLPTTAQSAAKGPPNKSPSNY